MNEALGRMVAFYSILPLILQALRHSCKPFYRTMEPDLLVTLLMVARYCKLQQ